MFSKVLITGATGLIGTELVSQLHLKNIDVHYFTTSKNKIENKPNYKGFYWNPENNKIDLKAFEGVSAIINLAGASVSKRWTKSCKKEILNSRTQSINLIYESLQNIDYNVSHFISASGISIYPSSKTKLYTEEDKDVDPTFLAAVSVAWEAAANQFKNLGIDVAIVRTGIVLSKKGGALEQIAKPIKAGIGASLGTGEQWQSWIHLDDIVGIYLFLLKNASEGIYNGVAPSPVTNEKLTKQIALQLHKSIWLPNVPGFVLRIALGEMSTIVLKGQLVSSRKIEESGYNFKFYNLESALQNLL